MIDRLSQDDVQDFIFTHQHEDEKKLLLKYASLFDLPTGIIANQLVARKKVSQKLPTYFATRGVVYPPAINLEQSSSETTAAFKAKILSEFGTDLMADLTGGFGVDSFFFAKVFNHVHYVEVESELMDIARHNHLRLGQTNIDYFNQSAEDLLQNTLQRVDSIFIDPSRRDSNKRKVFRFSESSPNVVELQKSLLRLAKVVLIKASPLIDIQLGISELRGVRKVYIIAVDNECKEILFQCESEFVSEPEIIAVDLTKNQNFSFYFSDERNAKSNYSEPQKFLYEPNAAVMKSGAFKLLGTHFKLNKIHPNTHLYTSANFITGFPGRVFEVIQHVSPKQKLEILLPDRKANVIARNYPLDAPGLQKKLGLKDGGDNYVLAFSGKESKHILLTKRHQ